MGAFNAAHLSAVGYANGYTRWHYRFDDDGVPPIPFFSPAWKQLRLGDQIDFISRTHTGTLAVAAAREGSVTVLVGWCVSLIDLGDPSC